MYVQAEEWLRNFLITQKADFDMKFEDFWKMYCADMETRLREHTMRTKKSWQERCDHSAKDTEEQESDYHSRVSGYRYQRLYGQLI